MVLVIATHGLAFFMGVLLSKTVKNLIKALDKDSENV